MKVCELASLVWGLGPRADSECPEADRQVHVFDSQRDFYGIHLEFCALSALARAEWRRTCASGGDDRRRAHRDARREAKSFDSARVRARVTAIDDESAPHALGHAPYSNCIGAGPDRAGCM